MSEKADSELVALARNGDKDAFGQLVQRYQALVRHFAISLVASEDIAQELAQEAMLQAYLSLDHLHNPARFKGWLCGIVLNICRSHIRNQKATFFSLEELAGGIQFDSILFSGATNDPERLAEESELHHAVLDIINSLAATDRDITLWFYYEQLSLQEIAEIQNISIGAVKVRLHRARKRLKDKLISHYPEIIPKGNRRKNMVKVTIFDVVKQERTDKKGRSQTLYVVILRDEAGQRILPIWIGAFEGQSIARALGEVAFFRPLTFDFFANILRAIKAHIEQVKIMTLKDTTFYATVKIRTNQSAGEIDARPSDALALAALTGSPVFVAEDVLAQAGMDIPQGTKVSARTGVEDILKEMQLQAQAAKKTPSRPLTREELLKSYEELISTIFGT